RGLMGMGRRKKHSPKHGSLAYLPRGRASRWRARVRNWPDVKGEPRLLGFLAYKAGTAHTVIIDNREGSLTFGKEIVVPVTILDAPPMIACALRAYQLTENGLKAIGEAWSDKLPPEISRVMIPPKPDPRKLEVIERSIDKIHEVRVIMATQPRLTSIGKKSPDILEVKVGGGSPKEALEYAKGLLGKEVRISDVFQKGQYLDTLSITKGKGVQGPVKRWGIILKHHKSRKTRRQVGTLGPWNPSFVMYSVPRAGQMGFFQRTEYNKQVLELGTDGSKITPKGGFKHYGIIRGDFAIISGSTPGPVKRAVVLRYPMRAPEQAEPPRIEYISLMG
ncbi:MAG: 50S ribosomal protein L3, partial [Candidatus Bathyarchaeia archaeon]